MSSGMGLVQRSVVFQSIPICTPRIIHQRQAQRTLFAVTSKAVDKLESDCDGAEGEGEAREPEASSEPPAKGPVYDGIVETLRLESSRIRLDQWLSQQLPRVSRARVQSSIRSSLAFVNGSPARKASLSLKGGDHVRVRLLGPTPFEAKPEAIALDVVFEDEHLLVINKPAHMVVHPAPGHSSGTLVNALLHHCGLPSIAAGPAAKSGDGSPSSSKGGGLVLDEEDEEVEETEEIEDEEEDEFSAAEGLLWSGPVPVIRPGVVHRLDKGTSGLLVVAKDDFTHEHLCNQFKARTVRRSYLSLTCGVPPSPVGRVDVPIGRDLRDRKRMAAFPFAGASSARTRPAASKYRVLEVLAQGGSALVEWRLETGRTHQIRVHAQHLGYPLLGDEVYGGTKGAATAKLLPRLASTKHGFVKRLVAQIERPCLHAQTLGFLHPWTGEELNFTSSPPGDFEDVFVGLRECGNAAVKK